MRKMRFLPILLAATVLVGLVAALEFSLIKTGNHGYLKNIGVEVYTDPACTIVLDHIDWGIVSESESYQQTFYIKNLKSTTVTLSYTTGNWNPVETPTYLTTSWNYTGAPIGMSQAIPVEFGLAVAPNIEGIGAFSYDMTILAVEAE